MDLTPLLTVAALVAADVDISRLTAVELNDLDEAAFADGVRHRDDPEAARPLFPERAASYFDELRPPRRPVTPCSTATSVIPTCLPAILPHAILSYRPRLAGWRWATSDLDAGLESA